MEYRSPNPAAVGTTYLDIPSISAEIYAVNSHSSEGHVNGVWNSILNWVFDPVDGYITRPQDMHTQYGGAYGFSDFHTLQWQGDRRVHLITQCKRYSEGNVWDAGGEQLARYLIMQHGRRPVAQRTRVYGILAIGLRVRFLAYDDAGQNVVPWRPGRAYGNSQGRDFYHIIDEANSVQRALRDMLHNN